MGDEVGFLPADKYKSVLQDDSITLDVHSQIYPKYPQQQVYSIFGICQTKREG